MKNQTKKLKDITTKLEHTQEMLQVSEDKYRQLVENADCIILRMGKDGKITFLMNSPRSSLAIPSDKYLAKTL